METPPFSCKNFPSPGAALSVLPGYKDAFFFFSPFPSVYAACSVAAPGLGNDSVSVGAWYDVNASSGWSRGGKNRHLDIFPVMPFQKGIFIARCINTSSLCESPTNCNAAHYPLSPSRSQPPDWPRRLSPSRSGSLCLPTPHRSAGSVFQSRREAPAKISGCLGWTPCSKLSWLISRAGMRHIAVWDSILWLTLKNNEDCDQGGFIRSVLLGVLRVQITTFHCTYFSPSMEFE